MSAPIETVPPKDQFAWEEAAYEDPNLTTLEKHLVSALRIRMNKRLMTYQSQETLARRMGYKSDRQVRRGLTGDGKPGEGLIEKGYLELVGRGHGNWSGPGTASMYRATLPATGLPRPIAEDTQPDTDVLLPDPATGQEMPHNGTSESTQPDSHVHLSSNEQSEQAAAPPLGKDSEPTAEQVREWEAEADRQIAAKKAKGQAITNEAGLRRSIVRQLKEAEVNKQSETNDNRAEQEANAKQRGRDYAATFTDADSAEMADSAEVFVNRIEDQELRGALKKAWLDGCAEEIERRMAA